MPRQRIFVLGTIRALHSRRPVDLPSSCKPLLSYLVLRRRKPAERLEVASALWAEMPERRARRCLSTAVWRLNGAFGGKVELVSGSGANHLSIRPGRGVWFDVEAFEYRIGKAMSIDAARLSARDRHRLAKGLALYHGEFSAGIYDDWILLERQRLHALYLDGLLHLTHACMAAGDHAEAIRHGRTLQRLEPLREDVHCLLMRAYMATGNRAKAIEQYRICQGELGSELGVEPMESTKALYRRVLEESGQTPAAAAEPERLAAALTAAAQAIDVVQRNLERSVPRLVHAQDMIRRARRINPGN